MIRIVIWLGFLFPGMVGAQTYHSVLSNVMAKKDSLAEVYRQGDSLIKEAVVQQVETLLYDELIEHVFPQWYGTEWDYEGYTNTPKQGKVACGYFVSTPLKHIGFQVNRYKLAQKYSHAIVQTLCSNIQYIRRNDTEKLFSYIQSGPNQLYVVGLDNHVGFISREATGIYFIHSSYIDPVAVVKERAQSSQALISSDLFVLGHFSKNTELLKKWLLGENIVIKTD
ncbi:MAG: hypothetical protein KDD41_02965 [Flavobacteriales bacterium]|nr:hypothetical protein [Flavobacteriales bacterium]